MKNSNDIIGNRTRDLPAQPSAPRRVPAGHSVNIFHNFSVISNYILQLNNIWQFRQINQLNATISQVYYLTFMYSSACFGRPQAHHQELNNCSSSLWFYRWSVVVAVLLVVVGPDHDQQHCYHHAPTVKPEAATAVGELLMAGVMTPETCWAVHKLQVINLRKCCI